MRAAAPTVDAHNDCTEGTRIHEKFSQGTDLYKLNQLSYEQPAALHTSKLEPYRSSEFIANVHRFEPGLGTTRVIPAGGCSPNDLQVHIISSEVALVKMMSVIFVYNNSLDLDQTNTGTSVLNSTAIYSCIGGLNY